MVGKSVMQAKPQKGHRGHSWITPLCGVELKGQDCCFAAATLDIYPDPDLDKTNATARVP